MPINTPFGSEEEKKVGVFYQIRDLVNSLIGTELIAQQRNEEKPGEHRDEEGYGFEIIDGTSIEDAEKIRFTPDMVVFGKWGHRFGSAPEIFFKTHGITDEDSKAIQLPKSVLARKGALTVQPSVMQEGAWKIFPHNGRICISVLFQRDFMEGKKSVVSGEDTLYWDSPEYPEQIGFFIDPSIWEKFAPEILKNIREWIQNNAQEPLSKETVSPSFIVSKDGNTEMENPATSTIIDALSLKDNTIIFDTPNGSTLDLLVDILGHIDPQHRCLFNVAANWMRDIHGKLNLHAGPQVSQDDQSRIVESMRKKTEFCNKLRYSGNNISATGYVQDRIQSYPLHPNEAGYLHYLIDGEPKDFDLSYFKSNNFVVALNEIIDLVTHQPSLAHLRESFLQKLLNDIKELSQYFRSLRYQDWENISHNRFVARHIGAIMLEAGPETQRHLTCILFLLSKKENTEVFTRLSEVMTLEREWTSCQWGGLFSNVETRARIERRISELGISL